MRARFAELFRKAVLSPDEAREPETLRQRLQQLASSPSRITPSAPKPKVALASGSRLGGYEILALIGQGGMGEVYRAKDTKLGRDVALKSIPASFTTDAERVARFRREAQVLASLNHPHIGQIYGLEESNGTQFLILELVDGESLDKRLARGAIPVEEALGIAKQIAEALEAAHEKGIIHRDLKPANIALTKDGQVKVLDFGLAKPIETPANAIDLTNSPTITSPAALSGVGMILGTAAYMSPEQARGRPLDKRADIWAFGCVLYEILTARPAFLRETVVDTTVSVLEHEPDWNALPRSIPTNVRSLLRRALQKDPQHRLRDLGDARLEIEEAQQSGRRRRQRLHVAAGFAGVLVVGTAIGLNVQGLRTRLAGVTRFGHIESLAVLPLENLSRDPEQDYFAEGMTEALITDLAQIKALRVISRTSVMRYKGTTTPLSEIAQALKVDAVLEGAVQRSGPRVRITVQLVEASTDRHIWAKSYEGDLRGVLGLQEEVGQEVAREIRVELSPQELARLATTRSVDPEAYENYLKGRYYWNRVNEEALQKAISYFDQAIEKDPGYAQAYAGLADCYTILGSTILGGLRPREAMPKAKAAALKALEIDNTVAEAHASLAMTTWRYEWDWPTAEREFKRAIELNPGYSTAHQWYGWYLYGLGRTDDSLGELLQAQKNDPLSVWINSNRGLALFFGRRYDRAIEQLRETIGMDPTFILGHFFLGLALEQQAMFAEAVAEFQQAVRLSGGSPEYIAAVGHAYAVFGKTVEARKTLDELQQLMTRRYVPAYEIATIYAGLEENEQAMTWLEKAYEERGGWLVYLSVDPRLDGLHSNRRFEDLLRHIGIPRA